MSAKDDPNAHRRRSVRLARWDYSSAGAYFVTICVRQGESVFGQVVGEEMHRNAWGDILAEYWQDLPRHFPTVRLGAFIVMPNHVHFIVWLNPPAEPVGAQFNCAPTGMADAGVLVPLRGRESPIGRSFVVDKQRPTLGQVVRAFNAGTARLIRLAGGEGFVWQRNYYEHIIRDEADLNRITQYILDNPTKWALDEQNPDNRRR